LEWSLGDHTKNSKKSPYSSFDYSSLKLILLVDGCQCDYITKSKAKKKKLGYKLEIYQKLIFSENSFPKKIVDFFFFRDKKITNEYLLLQNLRPKDCEISPRKNKKKSVAANSYKP
jgi:hypothetical protein